MMEDAGKLIIALAIWFLIFLVVVFGLSAFHTSHQLECRKIGMELSFSASDIQVICK